MNKTVADAIGHEDCRAESSGVDGYAFGKPVGFWHVPYFSGNRKNLPLHRQVNQHTDGSDLVEQEQ